MRALQEPAFRQDLEKKAPAFSGLVVALADQEPQDLKTRRIFEVWKQNKLPWPDLPQVTLDYVIEQRAKQPRWGPSRRREQTATGEFKRPLIEQVIMREFYAALGKFDAEHVSHRQCSLGLAGTPHKYIWTDSAEAMSDYLMPPFDVQKPALGRALPPEHLWVEFERPMERSEGQVAAVYLIHTNDEETRRFAVQSYNPAKAAAAELLRPLEDGHPTGWTFTIVDERGDLLWTIGVESRKNAELTFHAVAGYRCPWDACRVTNDPLEYCPGCKGVLEHWIAWVTIAFRMVQGEFAEREEVDEPEVRIVKTVRKEPRPDKPHKFHDVQVEHRLKIIRYDASVRYVPRSAPRDVLTPRGSWLEINPKGVVWVDTQITNMTRTFHHPRYVRMREKTIDIADHPKRIPMRLETLRHRLTLVEAKRYQKASTPTRLGTSS